MTLFNIKYLALSLFAFGASAYASSSVVVDSALLNDLQNGSTTEVACFCGSVDKDGNAVVGEATGTSSERVSRIADAAHEDCVNKGGVSCGKSMCTGAI